MEELATAKGRMKRGAGTGTAHGRATFMYIFQTAQRQGSLLQYWLAYVPFFLLCYDEEEI